MLRTFARGLSKDAQLPAISLLDSWRGLLLGGQPSAEQKEAVKDLLATAIRLRKGRPQHTLPDELSSTLRAYYHRLDGDRKLEFFHNLVSYFGVDEDAVDGAIVAWQDAEHRRAGAAATPAAEGTLRAADRLWNASQPLYSRLWVPLSQQQDGMTFLVRMRGDLLRCIARQPSGAAPLRALAEDLRRRLAEWFSVGLLQLQRITWESSSAAMLEKIMAEEKVHVMSSWEDMRRRLGRDRRVFIWTHPSIPGEPLVTLHVALSSTTVHRMSDIIGESESEAEAEADIEGGGDAAPPTTAVFYSISNMQRGLSGIDLGNNLIKSAAKLLLAEVPTLRTLCTLSPLPGFAAWLDAQLTCRARGAERESLLLEGEAAALGSAAGEHRAFSSAKQAALLQGALRGARWLQLPELEAALRPPLLRLAAHYLLREKRRGQVFDPVGNFHLRNGAEVHSLEFRADESAAGMRRSHGVMVSYRYDVDPGVVEANNRRYVVSGEVAVAPAVQRLLDAGGAIYPL